MFNSVDNYAGSGLAYKNVYNKVRGITRYSIGEERFNQSIALILETRIGESVANPKFGSRLHEVTFDPNTLILHEVVDSVVRDAIAEWEKRVDVIEVRFLTNEELITYKSSEYYDEAYEYDTTLSLGICINYRIKKTNITNSYIGYVKINSN